MDLLSKAYATASESDEDDSSGGGGLNHGGGVSKQRNPFPLPSKRLRPEKLLANPIRPQSHHMEAPIPGRYISKRQRAAASDPIPYYVAPSPGNFPSLLNLIFIFWKMKTI